MVLPILLAVLGAGMLAILYAWLIERNWFALRTHRVPCLPPGSPPLRVLHLSDLHFRSNLSRMRRFVTSLERTKPDLIVGTGDFLGDATSARDTGELIGSIPARLGGLFVLGSNDYYGPVRKNPMRYLRAKRGPHVYGPQNPWREMTEVLEKNGWQFLNNRAIALEGMDIVGLDDPHIHRHALDVAKPRTHDGFRFAVVHSPEVARKLAALGYDLIVAGHTHGGQLRVPLYGAIITNCQSLPRTMARGLHRLDGAWLHVSAGMGTSKYAPVRFFCRPEACLLELTPRT